MKTKNAYIGFAACFVLVIAVCMYFDYRYVIGLLVALMIGFGLCACLVYAHWDFLALSVMPILPKIGGKPITGEHGRIVYNQSKGCVVFESPDGNDQTQFPCRPAVYQNGKTVPNGFIHPSSYFFIVTHFPKTWSAYADSDVNETGEDAEFVNCEILDNE